MINPVSFKPSSPFTNIRLLSSSSFEIATYNDSRLRVQTTKLAEVKDFEFRQSSLDAGQEAYYMIKMQPGSRLPSTAAFKIRAPREIKIVRADDDDCFIET